ncbi:hypothetical protein SG34_005030 [Thalassomonas viridans]|uniref:Uncharacterized protein n=1 Tax=Thalassomonas viridans TaxID=137584 RepID=A0AAE9Z3X6_9GAMM|nr:hypothetical protein [Thalassomonas viridans]WDE06291.1 hypothetical protein SG34_005030 [Thalassomonas viridans]
MEKLFKLFGARQPQTGDSLSNNSEHQLADKSLDSDMLTHVVGGTDDTTTTDPVTVPGDEEERDTSPVRARSVDGIHPK